MSDRMLPGIHDGKSKSTGCGPGCLVIVVAIIVLGVVVGVIGSMNQHDPYDPNNRLEAIAQCEARIEEQLKAPSTAEFNSDASGNGTWTVTGTVDAENSFGATIRSEYQCTVKVTGEDTLSTRIDYIN
jgi:hypothetical protein